MRLDARYLIERLPDLVGVAVAGEGRCRDRRVHARPIHLAVELAAGGQHRVADHFDLEPAVGHAPQQAVVGVDAGEARIVVGAEPVGAAGQDQAVKCLQAPAVLDEPVGQPVEQLGMGRRLAHRAEVARGSHQADAEVVLPDPVDDHASRQGVGRVDQPVRQGEPAQGGLGAPGGAGNFGCDATITAGTPGPTSGPGLAAWPRNNRRLTGDFDGRLAEEIALWESGRASGSGDLLSAYRWAESVRCGLGRPLERLEDRDHAVIVVHGQRLELVVVAAGAAEGQPRKTSEVVLTRSSSWS